MIRNGKWQLNPSVPHQGSILERILAGRGIASGAELMKFMHGSVSDLHDPGTLPDIDAACNILLEERAAGREVIIHGDYDTDGITATALLAIVFTGLGIKWTSLIPDRLTDGYGIALEAVLELIAPDRALLVTVDCGIANVEEIFALKAKGVKVIITDHHECPGSLPCADAIINPKRPDSKYPFRELAGVGVALKLAQALCRKAGQRDLWLNVLDLASLGTIADVVPLLDENRILARLGLEKINLDPRPGIKALIRKINNNNKKITSRTVGFQISPRINAAGRVGRADAALDLLLTEDEQEADQMADELCGFNQRRLFLEAQVMQEAEAQLEISSRQEEFNIIIARGNNWHQGVLGIIASRLAERHHLPAIVLSRDDEGIYTGSARSWADFDIYMALQQAKNHLLRFGGHSKAAGLSLKEVQLPHFIASISEFAENNFDSAAEPVIEADLQLKPEDIDMELACELLQLEPFGEGNPEPLLISSGMILKNIRTLSEGRHIKLRLADNGSIIDAIGFGMGDVASEFLPGSRIDALYSLNINSWMGIDSVQLNLKDLRTSRTEGAVCNV